MGDTLLGLFGILCWWIALGLAIAAFLPAQGPVGRRGARRRHSPPAEGSAGTQRGVRGLPRPPEARS